MNEPVLFVDDDAEMRKVVAEALEDRGFKVTAVGTAAEGIELASSGDYELLIADWDLGVGACGMDVIQQAHGDTWTVLFSGLDRTSEIEKGVTEGRWHTKPHAQFTKDRLPELIDFVPWRLS